MNQPQTTAAVPYDATNHSINVAVAALRETFGLPFVLWENPQAWKPVFIESDATGELAPPLPSIAEETLAEGKVFPSKLDDQRYRLQIPIPNRGDWLVATLEVTSSEPDLLTKLGQAYQRKLSTRREIENSQTQIQSLCAQVSNDFEEILLLHDLAERLELSDASSALTEMAQIVFPTLRQSIRAESVVLLPMQRSSRGVFEDVTTGRQAIGESICWELIDQFGEESRQKPVVRNRLTQSSEACSDARVRDFVLVPIARDDHQAGWLLAFNRIHLEFTGGEQSRPSLSKFEFGTGEAGLLSAVAAMFATQSRNIELFCEKESLLSNAVRAWVSVIDARDAYTCGHSERVALFGKRLAEEIGLTEDECERLYLTGLLHDVGKIGVADSTLRKTTQLNDNEFNDIKRHPDVGWAILHDLHQLDYVLPGVVHHHERIDGKGYPDGLIGEDIPLAGRILAVADAYDAMTSDRPYRKGMPQEKAIKILNEGAGTQWDPKLVETFLRIMPDISMIRETYSRELPASRDGKMTEHVADDSAHKLPSPLNVELGP